MPVRVVEAIQGMHGYDKNNAAVLRNIDGKEEEERMKNNNLPFSKAGK